MSDQYNDLDPTAEDRKKDHIELAFRSQISQGLIDRRFYYEPIVSAHPINQAFHKVNLGVKNLTTPMWVSSMTGGTKLAATINKNLATACAEYGMGMGLGSCRSLLTDDTYLSDFAVRKYINDQPLYANLGIAQIEKMVQENKLHLIPKLISKLEADGLIVHVNPLQEWLQPEGDRYHTAPIETIKRLLDHGTYNLIVKEVGHGMGPESLRSLMDLPLTAIEFASNGGTNFSKIELARSNDLLKEVYEDLSYIGHSAIEMTQFVNQIKLEKNSWACETFILSGGVKSFLDGYYLIENINSPAVFGQASAFLKYAQDGYENLQKFVSMQVEGLHLAYALLKVRPL